MLASTKHKGLPCGWKEELNTDDKPFVQRSLSKLSKVLRHMQNKQMIWKKLMNEDYVKELEDGLVKMDYQTT